METLIKIVVLVGADLALNTAFVLFLLAPLLMVAWDLSVPAIIPGCRTLSYFAAVGLLGIAAIIRIAARGIKIEPR
jgi:hypothetical protein